MIRSYKNYFWNDKFLHIDDDYLDYQVKNRLYLKDLQLEAFKFLDKAFNSDISEEELASPATFDVYINFNLQVPYFANIIFSYHSAVFAVLLCKYKAKGKLAFFNDTSYFEKFAKENNMIPCLFPISRGDKIVDILDTGWNLIDYNKYVNDNELVPVIVTDHKDDSPVKLSKYEINALAVIETERYLKKQGHVILEYNTLPGISPSIIYKHKNGGFARTVDIVIVGEPRDKELETAVINSKLSITDLATFETVKNKDELLRGELFWFNLDIENEPFGVKSLYYIEEKVDD